MAHCALDHDLAATLIADSAGVAGLHAIQGSSVDRGLTRPTSRSSVLTNAEADKRRNDCECCAFPLL